MAGGSGGIVIIEMQRQMQSARGGQDGWSGLVFFLGLYGLFGAFLPVLGTLLLFIGIIALARHNHGFPIIELTDPLWSTIETPWRLWGGLVAVLVCAVQYASIVLVTPLLAPALESGAQTAALVLALVPAGICFYLVNRFTSPRQLLALLRRIRAGAAAAVTRVLEAV